MNTLNNETLFTSDECDIFYNKEMHVIMSQWKGIFVEGERLRFIFNQLIRGLELKKTSVIIADAREMKIIPFKDQQWTVDDWYPRALRAGFRHQGLILSKDTFNEVTVKKITQSYDEEIVTTNYFETPEKAFEWAIYLRDLAKPPYPKQH